MLRITQGVGFTFNNGMKEGSLVSCFHESRYYLPRLFCDMQMLSSDLPVINPARILN